MKTKYAFLLTGVAVFAISAAFGQVEYDDMYFSSKDRAKLKAAKDEILAKQYKQQDLQAVAVSPINPTDSYSGRGVNPEYTNRLKTNPNSTTPDAQYFVSGYQPATVNQNLASNKCNCTSNYFNNSNFAYGGYGMSSYGSGMYPLFGSAYNNYYSFTSPWNMRGVFNQPGWSSILGYGFGGMNSGWFGGMNYGYGNNWGSPWSYGYGSSLYNSFGYGYGYGMPYGGYGYPYGYGSNIVMINGGDNGSVVHGKRFSRSSDVNNYIDHSRPESGYTRNGREVASGRSRSDNQSQYYDRAWKRDPSKNTSRSFWSDSNSSSSSNSGSRSGWSNGSTNGRQSSSSGWGNNSWGNSSSRSSSSDSFGSGSRSSSGSFGGGSGGGSTHSSGGHSRGR